MIEVSSKKNLRNNLCERSEQNILGKFALFQSSLANVKSRYLFSVLQNDIHCILGSEKGGGAGPPGPPSKSATGYHCTCLLIVMGR